MALPTEAYPCLLYTSDAADDLLCVDLGGRRIIKKKKPTYDTFSELTTSLLSTYPLNTYIPTPTTISLAPHSCRAFSKPHLT